MIFERRREKKNGRSPFFFTLNFLFLVAWIVRDIKKKRSNKSGARGTNHVNLKVNFIMHLKACELKILTLNF